MGEAPAQPQAEPQPAYEEPAVSEPAYEEPAYEEPADEEPAYEEPADEEPVPLEIPDYAAPAWDDVPLSAGIGGEDLVRLASGDVLNVLDAVRDDAGVLWYHVRDYRTGQEGYLPESLSAPMDAQEAGAAQARIDAAYAQPPPSWSTYKTDTGVFF